jgi:outer membrane protein OmpA-like peptidoglycan-associated protein
MLVLVVSVVALFAIGVVRTVPRLEKELASASRKALAAQGIAASVVFDGQDASVSCATPVAEPAVVGRVLRAINGVHHVEVAASCTPLDTTTSQATTPTASTTEPSTSTTVAATTVVATTLPPSTSAVATTVPPTVPATGELLSIRYVDGGFVLTGTVASETQHSVVASLARFVTSADNVDDELRVDTALQLADRQIAAYANVLLAMPALTVSASIVVQHDGPKVTGVAVDGLVPDYQQRTEFNRVVTQQGLAAVVALRPKAKAADATSVARDMTAAASKAGILFDDVAGSSKVSPTSMGVLRTLAGMARRFTGLMIEVHVMAVANGATDRALGLRRASGLKAALVELGVQAKRVRPFGVTPGSESADQQPITFVVTVG